jgi:pimeloyl-ACP methyl ester carboxylesterase
MIEDHWVTTDEVMLHYLIAKHETGLTPLIYVPGSLGSADDFRDEMNALAPRTTVAVSPRGLGRSSAPERGYSLDHRVRDLDLVLETLDLDHYYLMAYSLGVPIAVAHTARNALQVRGLILLDYPAHYPERSPAWLEGAMPFARERGIPEHVVSALQREARPTDLWNELETIACPVLLVKGGNSPTISDGDLDRYLSLRQVTVRVFQDSGHEIHKPDYGRFIGTIRGFLEELDEGAS